MTANNDTSFPMDGAEDSQDAPKNDFGIPYEPFRSHKISQDPPKKLPRPPKSDPSAPQGAQSI